jgi:hypothetical protein
MSTCLGRAQGNAIMQKRGCYSRKMDNFRLVRVRRQRCRQDIEGLRLLPVLNMFTGNRGIMRGIIRFVIRAALLSAALAIVALPGSARAQGSAGGSVGNDEKSLSGSRGTSGGAEPSKPARSKPRAEEPSRASRRSGGGGGGGGNLDGAWVLTSVGIGCGSSTDTVVITGSQMVGQYGTAQVASNGSVSGIGSAGSLSWTMSGRFSGRGGSGTFRRSDGCAGSWTGSKR